MKSRTFWLAMPGLALLSVVAFIGSVKFYAQEQKTDVNPRTLSVMGGKNKQLPARLENIDPKTLAIMRRQEALQPAVMALYEASMKSPDAGFTSIAFEDDGLALRWKGPLNNDMLAAINKAREVGQVEIIPAPFSLAEMEAEAMKLDKDMKKDGGSDIQSVTTRFDGSGLDIERMPVSAAENITLERARAGRRHMRTAEQVLAGLDLRMPVRVTTADKPIELRVSRYNDTPAWNSGGYYVTKRSGQIRGMCTTGFGIRAYGRTWVLASAHCGTAPDIAYHGSAQKYMGPVTRENYRYDLMLIDSPGFYRMFYGPSTTTSYYNVYGWGYTVPGEAICYSSASRGVVCGFRTGSSTNVTVPSTSPDSDGDWGYTLYSLTSTYRETFGSAPGNETFGSAPSNQTFGSAPADSGAPVFTLMGSGVRAKGSLSLISGSNIYFQDWGDVIRLYGGYPVTP